MTSDKRCVLVSLLVTIIFVKARHPFKAWKEARDFTWQKIADDCAKLGHPTSADYLKMIGNGHSWPGWRFAEFLAEHITKHKVPMEVFLNFNRDEKQQRRARSTKRVGLQIKAAG